MRPPSQENKVKQILKRQQGHEENILIFGGEREQEQIKYKHNWQQETIKMK